MNKLTLQAFPLVCILCERFRWPRFPQRLPRLHPPSDDVVKVHRQLSVIRQQNLNIAQNLDILQKSSSLKID